MHRVVLVCRGVPESEGAEVAKDVASEFRNFRQYWSSVTIRFEEGELFLQADSDFDTSGLALADEFSDCICAYVSDPFAGETEILSVTRV